MALRPVGKDSVLLDGLPLLDVGQAGRADDAGELGVLLEALGLHAEAYQLADHVDRAEIDAAVGLHDDKITDVQIELAGVAIDAFSPPFESDLDEVVEYGRLADADLVEPVVDVHRRAARRAAGAIAG